VSIADNYYENIVEVLTNNAIASAAASSSNPTLSLPSSSRFNSDPYNQNDIYRKEEPESFDNGKGDIAD
jgi:hypothetical protein